MEEWLNYPLEDLLLFSRETYLRMFELLHRDLWPAHILSVALGIGILRAIWIGRTAQIRAMLSIFAVLWAGVGYFFHALRYADINWAADSFAWLFAGQAALLLISAIWPAGLQGGVAWARGIGAAVFAFALVVLPFSGLAFDRDWREVEFFAFTPDATALATLGVMIALAGAWRWLLALIPLGWCVIGGGTALAMDSPEAFVLGGVAAVAVLALIASAFAAPRSSAAQPG